jgi:hypothetical protein
MRKLKEYRRSSVNRISINYGGEKITFSLWNEVKIDEAAIERELKDQPSHYGFLLLLQKKLNTRFEQLKRARERRYGRLLIKAKEKRVGPRLMNDETAKAWVVSRKSYVKITNMCIKAKDDADTIYAAVRAFEQRKDLLQTISSNRRRES